VAFFWLFPPPNIFVKTSDSSGRLCFGLRIPIVCCISWWHKNLSFYLLWSKCILRYQSAASPGDINTSVSIYYGTCLLHLLVMQKPQPLFIIVPICCISCWHKNLSFYLLWSKCILRYQSAASPGDIKTSVSIYYGTCLLHLLVIQKPQSLFIKV